MAMQRKRRRRSGGNNNNNNNNSNPNKHFESNGPDVRIRGSAAQILEKYQQYARDAQTSGDRVKAEALFQHAEHYARIVAVFEKQKEEERIEREARDAAKAEERALRDAEREAERAARRERGEADDDTEADDEVKSDTEERPRRGRRRPREDREDAGSDALKVIDEDAGEPKAEPEMVAEEKPKRRRRTYARKDEAEAGDDGVMKTLSRGVEDEPA